MKNRKQDKCSTVVHVKHEVATMCWHDTEQHARTFTTYCRQKERRSIKPSLSTSMNQRPRTTWRTQNGIILRQFKKGTIYKDMGGVFPKPTEFHRTTLPSPNMAETREEQFLKPRRGVEGSVYGEELRVVIKVPWGNHGKRELGK